MSQIWEELLNEAERIGQEMKEYLIDHLSEMEFYQSSEYHVSYRWRDDIVRIWIANGMSWAKFDTNIAGINLDTIEYTDEERKKLWDVVQTDMTQGGTTRRIEMTRLSNDLFFKFKGVHNEVKFTGYDDNDWWTKHRPTEIKEDDVVSWEIDLNNMIATYIPSSKRL